MNREIKFRVWYKPTNEMLYGVSVNELGWIYKDGRFARDNEGVMQFTGLLDKNSKEIYEGDITKDGVGNIDTIVFHSAGYFAVERGNNHTFIEGERLTVIGTIWENEELLNG